MLNSIIRDDVMLGNIAAVAVILICLSALLLPILNEIRDNKNKRR